MESYEEPTGFCNSPGFVKNNPNNNESYLEMCCEEFPEWAGILRETDSRIEELVPGYNIDQIKEKFGGLRYYWSVPEEWIEEWDEEINADRNERWQKASEISWEAESKAVNLYALREVRGD